jgi:predicted nucleotidyltransferase component of viral defense system
MAYDRYAAQVQLLVRILPFVADEAAFALKGGTAINLFYRDMPRLSVDIDLVYLPIEDRQVSLRSIDDALERIVEQTNKSLVGAKAERIVGGGQNETRLLVRQGRAEVKVETSPVLRGTVHPVAQERPVRLWICRNAGGGFRGFIRGQDHRRARPATSTRSLRC